MPRNNPRRITKRKLLKFTGQQSDCGQIRNKLAKHEGVLAKLKQAGLEYDPETGTFQLKSTPELLNPEDLKDDR